MADQPLDRSGLSEEALTKAVSAARHAFELAADLEPEAPHGSDMLRIAVRDTGRGMSEDFIRTSLFRPFSTTKTSGLGIGLVQCKSIVEAHGGMIVVESRSNQGTTFTVRIPADARPREPAGEAA